jgi:hypothetical protein
MTKKRAGARKGARKSVRLDDRPLITIGDLRRRLRELGNPWQPDPTLSDDEPIPKFPTGGDGTFSAPGALETGESLKQRLARHAPPTDARLRKVWRKEGLLGTTRQPPTARSKTKAKPPTDGG